MTDFERLRDVPALAPLPGQADAALARVHDRRRRSALRLAGTASALAVLAAILTTRGPSTSMLEQTDEGVHKTATAVPSPTGHGGEADSAAGPRLATPGPDDPTPSTAPGPPTAVPTVTTSAVPTVSTSPVPPLRPRPEPRREIENAYFARVQRDGDPLPSCTPTAPNPSSGGPCWGINYAERPDEVLIRVTICTDDTDGYRIPFRTTQELDLTVHNADADELWHWARGMTWEQRPHEVLLQAEECVSWFLTWDYRDEWGRLVPKGRYRIDVPLLSDPAMPFAIVTDFDPGKG